MPASSSRRNASISSRSCSGTATSPSASTISPCPGFMRSSFIVHPIMANGAGAGAHAIAARARGEAEDVDRPGAGADVAQASRDRLSGERARDARRLQRVVAERELRCEHRRVRAAGAVRRAVGVALALDLDRGSSPAGPGTGRRRASRCPPVSTTAPGPSASSARASASTSSSSSSAPRVARARRTDERRAPRAGSASARSRAAGSRSRAPRWASASSSRAPDSATITGSTTTGVPAGSSSSACGDRQRHLGGAEHPDLDGVDADVRAPRAPARARSPPGPVDRADAERVLRGDRGDRARAVHAAARERLQVGLDAGAAAGVRAGDRQRTWGRVAAQRSAALAQRAPWRRRRGARAARAEKIV